MREFENPDHWDTAALHYERTAHPFTERYAEAALNQIRLGPGSRVLDVAAGTGALALFCRKRPFAVECANARVWSAADSE